MSGKSVSQVIRSLQDIMPTVFESNPAETLYADSSNDKMTCEGWVETAKKAREAVKKTNPDSTRLEQLEFALKYRAHLIKTERIAETTPYIAFFQRLSERAFPHGVPQEFTDFAKTQIDHLCGKYAPFAKNLIEKPEYADLADRFFQFCIQAPYPAGQRKPASHWVDIFVKFPEVVERLMRSPLYEKLGNYPDHIAVDKTSGVCLRVATIRKPFVPFNSKDDIPFRNTALPVDLTATTQPNETISLTLQNIFQDFEASSHTLDVSIDGIINLRADLFEINRHPQAAYSIDPKDWTKHLPAMPLTFTELQRLYPEVPDNLEFALVLRTKSYPSNSQAVIDFVMRLPSGDYQVFSFQSHQKFSTGIYQQQSVFCPLSPEQGKRFIDKVTEDIERARAARDAKKPIPSFNPQSYIDDVLGAPFYGFLDELISHLYPNNASTQDLLKDKLSQVKQNLDSAAFEKFLQPLIDKLVTQRDMARIHTFMTSTLSAIYAVVPHDHRPPLPSEEQVKEAGRAHLDAMKPSLLALAVIYFEVLHPYRMTVTKAEENRWIIGRLFRIIEAIPLEFLRNLLYNFFLTILGPFRGYHYQTLVTTHQKPLTRLVQNIRRITPEKYLNRPHQLFTHLSPEQVEVFKTRIQTEMKILAC